MAEKTLFQKILDRELDGELVYEDEQCGAFRDIHPAAPTHVLIVPRKPIPDVDSIQEDDRPLIGHLLYVARRVAEQEGLAHGYRLVVNCGPHAGQLVPHLHVHLLGGRKLAWPPG